MKEQGKPRSRMVTKETSFANTNLKLEVPFFGHSLHQKKKRKMALKTALKHVQRKEAEMEKLKNEGEMEAATHMKMQDLWQRALDKSEGKKIRDDSSRIKKTMKSVEKRKEKSKQQWKQRKEEEGKRMAKRQQKRVDNIKKRKMDKKNNKTKKRK